ncbi:hypothetical protein ONS96_001071 [Cadophora gregata f. sp. sojae]|nr:hypothetical protein ONS96_001071 [Cadophora gregata f. sp. sojae]
MFRRPPTEARRMATFHDRLQTSGHIRTIARSRAACIRQTIGCGPHTISRSAVKVLQNPLPIDIALNALITNRHEVVMVAVCSLHVSTRVVVPALEIYSLLEQRTCHR